ncbi:hypothetical protein N9M30_03755 [Pseudomonadales bacterium]|nr:hypothetical protein [Pseudomonadales bacterium]MDA8703050.1 hypothetical protein [Pseudomonadales bacterium]MDB0049889.1 hypothetical protein [Pseudomonadales bacterium]MDC1323047.1 hypothetical protein [Pseudomonadales bacterium]
MSEPADDINGRLARHLTEPQCNLRTLGSVLHPTPEWALLATTHPCTHLLTS